MLLHDIDVNITDKLENPSLEVLSTTFSMSTDYEPVALTFELDL